MDQEIAFTEAILASPNDDAARLVYADWLEERGDPRGEWLRITVQLQHLAWNDPPDEKRDKLRWIREVGLLRNRLRKLRAIIPEGWALKLQQAYIMYCGVPDADCPREWLRFAELESPNQRRCRICKRIVQYCWSAAEVSKAVLSGSVVVRALAMDSSPVDK